MENINFNNCNYDITDLIGFEELNRIVMNKKRYTIEDFKKEYISSDYEGLFNNLLGKRFILLEGHTGIGKSHLAECLAKLIVGYDDTEGLLITRTVYGSYTAHYLTQECKKDKTKVVIIDGINWWKHDFVNINDIPDNVYIICTTLGNQKTIDVNGLERFYRYTPENILGTEALMMYIKEKIKDEELLKNTLRFLDIIKNSDISMRWLEELETMCERDMYSTRDFCSFILYQTKIKCKYSGMEDYYNKLQDFLNELGETFD